MSNLTRSERSAARATRDELSDEENELDMSYEEERLENIKNNAALLASLGLSSVSLPTLKPRVQLDQTKRSTVVKKEKVEYPEPSRRSGRVAALQEIGPERTHSRSNSLHSTPSPSPSRKKPLPKAVTPIIPTGPTYNSTELQRASRPRRKVDGSLIFEGRWENVFKPNITPEEMFTGGAFGGSFFCNTYSRILHQPLSSQEDLVKLPFTISDSDRLLSNDLPDGQVNRFKVRAGQSLQEWEKAGWIWSGDPRGWAEWYVKFWDGRRCEDDERQVRRWLKVAGPTGRFKRALVKKIHSSGGRSVVEDEDVGRTLRQCLWQWGYQLTLEEYDLAIAGEG
ncbi:hypothetical protein M231_00938 [Tremella mesenterica]|uniref:Uncharacterized protein n=1 Tax=Tremella mesenterica TaxID=5217 RepID=A0A4Q1BUB9_TREME|nr:hypothetical protein M231_00938 [Tremella mesenterica]